MQRTLQHRQHAAATSRRRPTRAYSRRLARVVALAAIAFALAISSASAHTCPAASRIARQIGVDVSEDNSCGESGADVDTTGCFSASCRFCQTFETPRSEPYVRCASFEALEEPHETSAAVCLLAVSSADASAGIAAITDASCVSIGGLGCLGASVCRLCRTMTTSASEHLTSCGSLLVAINTNGAVATPASVISSSSSATPAPAPLPPATSSTALLPSANDDDVETPAMNYCSSLLLDEGQVAAGIWAVVDEAACSANPSACPLAVCRLCKYAESPASASLRPCPPDMEWLLSYTSS